MAPDFYTDVPLSDKHTFGLQAKAARWLDIVSKTKLYDCCSAGLIGVRPVHEQLVLGEGSNTVFMADYAGTVIHMGLRGIEVLGQTDSQHLLKVAAGENWHSLVEWALVNGFPGLENLALIPGSVGASPVQNIGAYGLEVCERIYSVEYFDLVTGQFFDLPAAECDFSYRHSRFKADLKGRALITAVTFCLPCKWQPVVHYKDVFVALEKARESSLASFLSPRDVFDAVVGIRTLKLPDPMVYGNSGSFFKNPIVPVATLNNLLKQYPSLVNYPLGGGRSKLAAGWLIQQLGLKGYQIGGARVSNTQALVLFNQGCACSEDLTRLIQHIQLSVSMRFGVQLEVEPELIGHSLN
jgi:UDP-N-acetylmuramate dehydrogenase